MAKYQKFKDYEDEWGTVDDYRKDGKRYSDKKRQLKNDRDRKASQRNKFFDDEE